MKFNIYLSLDSKLGEHSFLNFHFFSRFETTYFDLLDSLQSFSFEVNFGLITFLSFKELDSHESKSLK